MHMSHLLVHVPPSPPAPSLGLLPSPPPHSALQSPQEPWLQLKPGRGALRGRWYSKRTPGLGSWLMSCAGGSPVRPKAGGGALPAPPLSLLLSRPGGPHSSQRPSPTCPAHLNDQGLRGGATGMEPLRHQVPLSSPLIVQDGAGHGQGPGALDGPVPVEVVVTMHALHRYAGASTLVSCALVSCQGWTRLPATAKPCPTVCPYPGNSCWQPPPRCGCWWPPWEL